MGGLTRSASLSSFGEVARQAGLDPNALLREFDLPERCLTEPELRIPADSVRRLLEAAADRSGVEGFGLRMAQARLLSDMGPLGLLMREQPTLRLALEACANYANRLNAALYFTIEESPNVVVLREDLILGVPGPLRQSAELAMGVVFRVLQTFMVLRGWSIRHHFIDRNEPHKASVETLPKFLIVFIALVAIGSLVPWPQPLVDSAAIVSRYCLLTAVAALGLLTHTGSLLRLGWQPVVLMVALTLVIALVAALGVSL